MSYIQHSLAAGETVRVTARIHWIIWVRAWAALLVLGIVLVGIVIFIHDLIALTTTEIAITDRRLILKRGLLGRSTSELELATVEAVRLNQDMLGRFLGWGRVEVHGTGDDVWLSPLIAQPVQFRRELESALMVASRAAAKTAA